MLHMHLITYRLMLVKVMGVLCTVLVLFGHSMNLHGGVEKLTCILHAHFCYYYCIVIKHCTHILKVVC